MKANKIIFFVSIISMVLISCNNKSPEQEILEKREKAMLREQYIDSLLYVAGGVGKYEYMKENRLNALRILREEYPSLSHKWDSIQNSIYK